MRADRPASPLIPGFDFLKNLASQAGKGLEGLNQINQMSQGLSGLSGLGAGIGAGLSNGLGGLGGLGGFKQWVAPTLDPDELDKRIDELKTVQFWLEQNARLLGATIQALEVQKMTLSTLRSMNLKMPDLQQVLGAMVPPTAGAAAESVKTGTTRDSPLRDAGAAAGSPDETDADEPDTAPDPSARSNSAAARTAARTRGKTSGKAAGQSAGTVAGKAAEAAAGLVDPMKWWGALTEQFQQLAAQALASAPQADPGASVAAGSDASTNRRGAAHGDGASPARKAARSQGTPRPATKQAGTKTSTARKAKATAGTASKRAKTRSPSR